MKVTITQDEILRIAKEYIEKRLEVEVQEIEEEFGSIVAKVVAT
jgi:hypothetical protein